ncbi:MAG: hypothetical protein MJ192_06375 [Clostridia bacterium]|nr:hypothetical protein [Clostridia bacterium]
MSRSRQTKTHVDHKAARARAEKEQQKQHRRNAKSVVRIRLISWLYVVLTALIILAGVTVMIVFEKLGWFEGFLGAVLSVLIAGFTVMCIFDEALLLTASVTVADGQVTAGKNEKGELMVFHAENIARIELRDKSGEVIPETKKRYKASVTFVMISGRVNQRPVGIVSQSKLDRLREACRTSKAPEPAENK